MRFTTCLLLLALSGCASVPMAGEGADAQGKRFEPPPAGEAALYIYRESVFAAAYSLPVSLGPRQVGALATDTWFRIDLTPGSYEVACTTDEKTATATVTLAPDETRYVEAAMRIGWLGPRCGVFEVSPEKGRQAVMAGRRAQAQEPR